MRVGDLLLYGGLGVVAWLIYEEARKRNPLEAPASGEPGQPPAPGIPGQPTPPGGWSARLLELEQWHPGFYRIMRDWQRDRFWGVPTAGNPAWNDWGAFHWYFRRFRWLGIPEGPAPAEFYQADWRWTGT